MILQAGQRYVLTDENKFYQVIRGQVEVYAVTNGALSFRQTFLVALTAGMAVYPAMDEFEQINTSLYAVTEAELEELSFEELPFPEQLGLMRQWFGALVELPWMRMLADRGDDVLLTWRDGSVLKTSTQMEELERDFKDQEGIFAMLLGTHFVSEEKKLSSRIATRARHSRVLIDEAMANLLDEEMVHGDDAAGDDSVTGSTFLVRRVAQFYKMATENIEIESEVARKLDGMQILRRLMQKGNMQMRLVQLEKGWHRKDSGVLIGSIDETGENVALIPETPSTYRICSAKNPEGVPVDDRVAAQLASEAFACYPGFPSRKLSIMDLIKFIFHQCWLQDYKWLILASFIGGLVPLATPIITETIFQDIIPIQDRQGLATVTQVTLVTSFTLAAMSMVTSIAVLRLSTHIDMFTEAALWGRLLSLPTKFFRKFQAGELASRMRGIDAVKSVVSAGFINSILSCVFSIWSILLMCYYSVKLAAAAVAVWAVYCLITAYIYRRVLHMQRKLIAAENKESGMIQQIFSGLAKFRVQGAEEQAFMLWSRVFGESWKWNLALRWQGNYNMLIGSMQPFILNMVLFYMAVYGLDTVVNGKVMQGISYAEFMAFQAAYTSFNGALNSVIPLVAKYFEIQPHIENLRPILDEVPESTEDKMDAAPLTGALEVSHLTFGYKEGVDVLKDVSFKINAGENVAIVGRSGCGKSTLVRMLLGFEVPKTGAVYYDGTDLSELSLPSVRSQMGVVIQNGQLMSGDIFTNIVGMTSLTLDDAWKAAMAAGVAEDIAQMPMGMQTVISEGSNNISGGQRQRILIARALAVRPKLLIFDEATSALDNRTQAIVMNTLSRLKATRIVVAHRLSTIKDADRIIVMDDGRVAEQGTYAELVEKGGLFAQLVARQVA